MGLLVIYAVFMTLWAIAMTIEYYKVVSYKHGYNDAKKQMYEECEKDIQSFNHSESGDGVLVWKNNECCK